MIFSLLDGVQFAGRCWAILPDVLYALEAARDTPIVVSDELQAALGARSAPKEDAGGQVVTIPLKGMITPDGTFIEKLFGIPGGLEVFRKRLNSAAGNEDVKSIVLDVDSPGGLVDQVPETAAVIRAAAERKPIVAVANPLAASAAYWLASNATQFVGSTSSETGAIGVYQMHQDISGAQAKAGIKPTLISAGKYKTEGNPFEPITDEARAAAQESVDDFYRLFVADVAQGRGVSERRVRNGFGEGRVLTAQRAKDAGMIDAVATLDTVVGGLAQGKLPSRRRAEDGSTVVAIDGETVWSSKDFEDDEHESVKQVDYSVEDRLRILSVMAR